MIAETRILNVSERWVIFKFKDYAEGGKSSVKKMGLFTFIKYLIQHIPDKGGSCKNTCNYCKNQP